MKIGERLIDVQLKKQRFSHCAGGHRLHSFVYLAYTTPVAPHCATGFGIPSQPYDASRRTSVVATASLSVPPSFGGSDGGLQGHRFRKGCPAFQPRSSHRPRLESRVVVSENHNPWRPFMANASSRPDAPSTTTPATGVTAHITVIDSQLYIARVSKRLSSDAVDALCALVVNQH